MQATYQYAHNLGGAPSPLRMLLPCAAGSTQAIKPGEWCKLEGGVMVPLDADEALAGQVAQCAQEVFPQSLAGFYEFIIPRPDDVFKAPLTTAAAADRGDDLYFGTTTTFAPAGTNAIATVVNHTGFPLKQGDPTVGDVANRGNTVASAESVEFTIKAAASYYAVISA